MKPAAKGTLWFVIPALNERENLPALAPKLVTACDDLEERFHVVFVDDGSTDGSADVARELWGERCTVLRHEHNRGPGMAMKTGFLHVLDEGQANDLVVTLEADGTSDFDILHPLLAFARTGWDLALASPYAPGGGIEGTDALRRGLSFGANMLCRQLLGLGTVRTYSSFYRVHTIEVLWRLREAYGDALIEEAGFSYALEMLTKLMRLGARAAEVPMVLDGARRIGESRMKIVPTVRGYLRIFRRLRR